MSTAIGLHGTELFYQGEHSMKIAVTGAHRVGKTTLVNLLLESLPEYEFKEEAYYELEEKGFVFSEVPGPEDYVMQLEHSLKQISAGGKNVIFDRCPIDLLAYIQATQAFNNINIQAWYRRVYNVMSAIDLLVFVPVEAPDVIGCPESGLPELRHQVNEILHDWIWDFGIDVVEVVGSPLSRRNQVMTYLSKI